MDDSKCGTLFTIVIVSFYFEISQVCVFSVNFACHLPPSKWCFFQYLEFSMYSIFTYMWFIFIVCEIDHTLSVLFGNGHGNVSGFFVQVIWGITICLYLHLARCLVGGISTCPMAVQKPWTLPEIYHLDRLRNV